MEEKREVEYKGFTIELEYAWFGAPLSNVYVTETGRSVYGGRDDDGSLDSLEEEAREWIDDHLYEKEIYQKPQFHELQNVEEVYVIALDKQYDSGVYYASSADAAQKKADALIKEERKWGDPFVVSWGRAESVFYN